MFVLFYFNPTTVTDTENIFSATCGIYKIHKHNILESYIEINTIELSFDVGSYSVYKHIEP